MTEFAYSEDARREIAAGLRVVLADTFVLYFKTHSFHWNVEGPRFKSLHELFEEQYTELWGFTDACAERIRALDSYGPGSFKEILAEAGLQEAGQIPDAQGMIEALEADNRAIVAGAIFPALRKAQEAGDEASADLLIGRIEVHEKAAWMLRSLGKAG